MSCDENQQKVPGHRELRVDWRPNESKISLAKAAGDSLVSSRRDLQKLIKDKSGDSGGSHKELPVEIKVDSSGCRSRQVERQLLKQQPTSPTEPIGFQQNPLDTNSVAQQTNSRVSNLSIPSTSLSLNGTRDNQHNNMHDVKDNFIKLNRHNKSQYFYIGALIYSVMNISFIYYSTIKNEPFEMTKRLNLQQLNRTNKLLSSQTIESTNSPYLLTVQNLNSSSARLTSSSTLESTIDSTKLGHLNHRHKPQSRISGTVPKKFDGKFSKTLMWILLALSVILILVLVSMTMKFAGHELKVQDSSNSSSPIPSKSMRLLIHRLAPICASLESIGLLVALTILHLSPLYQIADYFIDSDNHLDSISISLLPSIDLSSSLILLYLEPILLEGSAVNAKLICAFTFILSLLVPYVVHYSQINPNIVNPSQATNISNMSLLIFGIVIVAVFMFGLCKSLKFVEAINWSTFAGASRLIEARVSLEHQRQQQETLLLSVLPAYVAEQVKRNMVKKMNSISAMSSMGSEFNATSAQTASVTQGCQTLPSTNQGQMNTPIYQQVITSVSPVTGQANSRIRAMLSQADSIGSTQNERKCQNHSLTVSIEAGGIRNSISRSCSQMNSTIDGSKMIARDASTYNIHAAAQSDTQQPIASLSAHPNIYLSSSCGQARRGFNELYIRTYNNVSLLYGDIVGFTRLCTQLSSSQLVRVLNDLFSHFDYLAERHKIMRIKILGDCYYGVSGIPEFAVMGAKSRASRNDNHAINCVNMGLDMIQYITCLNVERTSGTPINVSTSQESQIIPHSASVNICTDCHSSDTNQNCLKSPEKMSSFKSVGNCYSPLPHFELNMRIGVHSGHIHSGVIGLKKWQFDVWSNDVSIAMHCESSGVAGRVQVTESTIQQLNGEFTYERATGVAASDSFLSSRDIKTYLIRDRVRKCNMLTQNSRQISKDCTIINKSMDRKSETTESKSMILNEEKIRTATIETIRNTILAGELYNSCPLNSYGLALDHPDISMLTMNYREAILNPSYSRRPVKNYCLELVVLIMIVILILPIVDMQAIRLLKVYVSSSAKSKSWIIIIMTTFLVIVLLGLIFALWAIGAVRNDTIKKSMLASSEGEADLNSEMAMECETTRSLEGLKSNIHNFNKNFISQILNGFRTVKPNQTKNRASSRHDHTSYKYMLVPTFLIVVAIIQGYLIIWILDQINFNIRSFEGLVSLSNELYQLTLIMILIIVDSCRNLLTYRTKLVITSSIFIVQIMYLVCIRMGIRNIVSSLYSVEYRISDADFITSRELMDWSDGTLILILSLWILGYGRQYEYINRVNFLWRNRLNVDHEELEYISGINKVLLENILPSHVVQHYLTHPCENQLKNLRHSTFPRMSFSNMRNLSDELYHEQHDNVAVMFASIPHFYEFYDESDISKQGLGCIALLNEIICDFDKLLLKNKFSRIEKIKTIGSTYMAAAGLRPSYLSGPRNSDASQVSQNVNAIVSVSRNQSGGSQKCSNGNNQNVDTQHPRGSLLASQNQTDEKKFSLNIQKMNLVCMIQFAFSLMATLNVINKQSFQGFRLRVGVNAGSVMAGVIGAQRPFYDIWGDCVNIASRMETLGQVERIQVEERTAKLMMDSLCAETYKISKRGPIDVKGKGGMVTYFIDKSLPTNSGVPTDKNIQSSKSYDRQ